jgi:L-alanine-DL-glutamate epimerase-like enolase superfamily enzyme
MTETQELQEAQEVQLVVRQAVQALQVKVMRLELVGLNQAVEVAELVL